MSSKMLDSNSESKGSVKSISAKSKKHSSKLGIPDLNYKDTLKKYPEVISYIEKLHEIIKIQHKKLSKIKRVLNHYQMDTDESDAEDASVQPKKTVRVGPWASTNQENGISIADEVKQAAEDALSNNGLVYEPTTGLYYDYNTGYYYNSESGLYWDGVAGVYMYYNEEEKEYVFHSRPDVIPIETDSSNKKDSEKVGKSKLKRKLRDNSEIMDEKLKKPSKIHRQEAMKKAVNKLDKKDIKIDLTSDLEDGECSEDLESQKSEPEEIEISEIADSYPPAMRIIVQESELSGLKMGSLFLVTFKGGTLGREGDVEVLIPDPNISKYHIRFSFNEEQRKYYAVDLGSRNGSILNGNRMSVAKQESDPLEILHGSVLEVGCVKLLCHIHKGNATCGHCEPGLIQQTTSEKSEIKPRPSKRDQHHNEIKRIRKKFGIEPSSVLKNVTLPSEYKDRAEVRRQTVGLDNQHAKTETASVDQSISSENKGFKLLSKMGWTEGSGLGKGSDGLKEPVALVSNEGKSGLGADVMPVVPNDKRSKKKRDIWKKTQQRFEALPKSALQNVDSGEDD